MQTGADKKITIAIDGPNGSGKSTVAKLLAQELNIIYIDTGAMYRAVALYLLRNKVPPDDYSAFDGMINELVDDMEISIRYEDGLQKVFLFDEDVTALLRTREVSEASSKFAVKGHIREKLVKLQKRLAFNNSVVMDGRDIGACVLPDATLKIYLDAAVDARASRRVLEYKEKGVEADYEVIKKEIAERDYRDKNRENSPLVKVEEAVVIDSSQISADEVAEMILKLI